MAGHVRGYCPMGCGQTLFANRAGHILCANGDNCPRPNAVDNLLADRETEHIVVFDDKGFTVKHPLRERLDDALLTCQLHTYCADLPGPPPQLGTYRVTRHDDRWRFARMESA